MPIHFPIGTRPHLAKKGGGGHVPEMPPLDPPMLAYIHICLWTKKLFEFNSPFQAFTVELLVGSSTAFSINTFLIE